MKVPKRDLIAFSIAGIVILAVLFFVQKYEQGRALDTLDIVKVVYIFPRLNITWIAKTDAPSPIKELVLFYRGKWIGTIQDLDVLNEEPLLEGDTATLSILLDPQPLEEFLIEELLIRVVFLSGHYQEFKVDSQGALERVERDLTERQRMRPQQYLDIVSNAFSNPPRST